MEELHQLVAVHVEQLVQIHATELELSECPGLLLCVRHCVGLSLNRALAALQDSTAATE